MSLEGLHHVTAITGDAQRNVDFYVRVMGLRMIKKTINHDQPDVYHLYYGDEAATPGAALTFFEYPGAAPGRAGDGMVHTVSWRVASPESLQYWRTRLADEGVGSAIEAAPEGGELLRFADPEGMTIELHLDDAPDQPLTASDPEVDDAHALRGFHGVRAYASDPARSADLLSELGFVEASSDGWLSRGDLRGATYHFDPPPPGVEAMPGGGTVHHVAWSAADDDELAAYRERAQRKGARPTPIIDRVYFHSVYFREPSGVLFELASRDGGFDADEPADKLGESLVLPPQHEHMRAELERRLTPLTNPRPRS